MARKYKRPRLRDTFTELSRTAIEFALMRALKYRIHDNVPQGNGQPVLILPGFSAHDYTTAPLRQFLEEQGYKSYGWEYGLNWSFNARTAEHLVNRLERIYEENGRQKVALIGHSMGGIMARELARDFPDKISQVITLGSPFGALKNPGTSFYFLESLIGYLSDVGPLTDEQLADQLAAPPPVPTTSIYTQADGIVGWRACLNPKHRKAENIEVKASHCGLVVNPLSYIVIADRLAQPEGRWKAFDLEKYPNASYFLNVAAPEDLPPKPGRTTPHRPLFRPA